MQQRLIWRHIFICAIDESHFQEMQVIEGGLNIFTSVAEGSLMKIFWECMKKTSCDKSLMKSELDTFKSLPMVSKIFLDDRLNSMSDFSSTIVKEEYASLRETLKSESKQIFKILWKQAFENFVSKNDYDTIKQYIAKHADSN